MGLAKSGDTPDGLAASPPNSLASRSLRETIQRVDTPRMHQRFSRVGVDVSYRSSRLLPSDSPPATADDPKPDSASASAQPAPQPTNDRYQDGIVIWETPPDDTLPFLLKFNVNTQIRYLNTLGSDPTYTDHLGVTRDVHERNDITVNRAMFILGGYIFDPRARYSFTVWTSAGAASIIVAGNIGWQFSRALSITGGYTGVPGSRSLVATFPFFTATDRSMADNFFRPGFTQGVWANGDLGTGRELSGVRRQRSQYPEYLGQQDRYASAVVRQCLVGTDRAPTAHPASPATCTTTTSPPRKFACELVPRSRDPGRTVFQISINQVPRTLRCTTPTACCRSRPERLRRV